MIRLPFLEWGPLLRDRETLRIDLLAGLTGAIVVLPQGLAFATLAGVPPQHGLYAAMVPCAIAALFGSSRLMVTGPANAISLTTMALIAPLAAPGSAQYVSLVVTLTLLVGMMQLLLGFARAGKLVEYVPHSVIVGFTTGAAVLIANSQLATFLGVELPRGASVFANVAEALRRIPEANPLAVLAGVVTFVAIRLWAPLNRFVPAMLIGVVVGSAAAWLAQLLLPQAAPLRTVPPLPGALPMPALPDFSLDTMRTLFSATLVMTLLGLTEAVAIGSAFALRRKERFDGNQEFIGQGLANVAGSLFQAIPASGSFNRSAVNAAAGARTPLSAASAAVMLVVLVLAVGPLARYLPLPVIAGLLFMVAWGLIDRAEILRIWRHERFDRPTLVVTFLATITLSLEWAILLGLVTALIARRWLREA